jgi:DUF971 family protein
MAKPVELKLHRQSRILDITFNDGVQGALPCEYLRVYSPSAEVRGHGPSDAVLQTGKENVSITEIESVGNYAVRLIFSDGHNTGLYAWDYLYELTVNQEKNWQDYLQRLETAGFQRRPSS